MVNIWKLTINNDDSFYGKRHTTFVSGMMILIEQFSRPPKRGQL